MNQQQHIRAAMLRIGAQVPTTTPEAQLMFAIVCSAILDLSEENHRESAKQYLKGNMIHAQMIGLDPDWIRSTLKELRLFRG